MNWFEYLLYGLVSGLSEFLPVTSRAHQQIMETLFGVDQHDPLLALIIHASILASIFVSCRTLFEHLRRERRLSERKGRRHLGARRGHLDIQLTKTAAIPLFVSMIFYPLVSNWSQNLPLLSIFLLINSVILYLPSRMVHGNKEARAMTGLDGLLIGVGGALGVFPGISRMAGILSVATARGADTRSALNWSVLLSIPALIILIVVDLFSIVAATQSFSFNIGGAAIAAIGAFGGGYLSVSLMQFLAVRKGFAGFAYYSWGAALFSFILYLTV